MTILSYLKFSISMKIIDKSKTSSVDSGQANTTYKKRDRYSIYCFWFMNTYIITYSYGDISQLICHQNAM